MKKCSSLVMLAVFGLCGCFGDRGFTRRNVTSYPSPAGNYNLTSVPADTTFDARLNATLDSGTPDRKVSREGDLFTATVVNNVYGGGGVAILAGTTVKGRVEDIQHIINRTSIKLYFYELVLPDGRAVPINAAPKPGSKVKMDEMTEGGKKIAKDFLIEKGIDAITAGVFAPLWVAKKLFKGYEFVTKEERMVLPKGSVIEIQLEEPAYLPRRK